MARLFIIGVAWKPDLTHKPSLRSAKCRRERRRRRASLSADVQLNILQPGGDVGPEAVLGVDNGGKHISVAQVLAGPSLLIIYKTSDRAKNVVMIHAIILRHS